MRDFNAAFPLRRFYLFLSHSPFFSHQSRSGGSIDQFRGREIALCSPEEWTTRRELAPAPKTGQRHRSFLHSLVCQCPPLFAHLFSLRHAAAAAATPFATVTFIITRPIINHAFASFHFVCLDTSLCALHLNCVRYSGISNTYAYKGSLDTFLALT